MRVALVHDYLSQCGGAERVLLQLAEMFPEAPIYTSFFAPERTYPEFSEREVRTSSLQGIDPAHFRRSVLRYPRAFRSFDLSGFETVITSSSAFAHHVVHDRCFVYCHTPPRFLYQLYAYGFPRPVEVAAEPLLAILRRADRRAARGQRAYAANSAATRTMIRHAYDRDSDVIHPPLWTRHLPSEPTPFPATPRALLISRLLRYKRSEVAIEACQLAGVPLTVVGEGPEAPRLRAIAGTGVKFLGRVSDAELAGLFAEHSVMLVPGREDFGYIPVEANYAGRPVVALRSGGALETVIPEVTGLLVDGHDPAAWAKAIVEAHHHDWSPTQLREATALFQAPRFESAIHTWLGYEPPAAPPKSEMA